MMTNLILNTDSYKASHFLQYPQGTEYVSSYIEARGGEFDQHIFFGLQMFIQEYLTKPITMEDINEAEAVFGLHGVPFNRDGWEHILENHNGYLPIEISAIPEGTKLPLQNVLAQVINTDPAVPWLTSYVETMLLRAVWYPTTVATVSLQCKNIIKRYLEDTADNTSGLPFKLHDFGARGASSMETAAIGGLAHLVNFMGTDTVSALTAARKYYAEEMPGFSIPASEHSTITVWGKEREVDAYRNMLKQFGGENNIVAVVSDSYDLWNAIDKLWGETLKNEVIGNGGTLVVRPDSGDPVEVVLEAIERLMDKFGYYTNSKGFRMLPNHVRLIQGDGVSPKAIEAILENLKVNEISADNVAFGMGGELLQKVNRDTLKFAMKASAAKVEGKWIDVYKDPVTDKGKRSKKGELALVNEDGVFKTIRKQALANRENLLRPVYRNGDMLNLTDLATVRALAEYVSNIGK
jgi:nicotinamide phosphoribosyltransferase